MAKTFHVDPRSGIILRWAILLVFIVGGFAYVEWSSRTRFDLALLEATTITKETRKRVTDFIDKFQPIKQIDVNAQHLDKLENDFESLRDSIQELNRTVESFRKDLAERE